MIKQFFLFLCCCIITSTGFSQKPWELGGEYQRLYGQGYSGNRMGVRYESFSNKSSWSLGLTYNFSTKKSYSVSKGFGVYAGYRYGFSNSPNGNPFAGLRAYLSFESFEGKANVNGMTITPVAEAGYHFISGKHLFASPALGFGYCIRLTHENNSLQEDEGIRFIPGIAAGFRF